MTSNLSAVVAKLGLLSPSELQTVQATTTHLLSGKVEDKIEEDEEDLFMFYAQLAKSLSLKGINVLPWVVFKKRRLKSFRELKRKFSSTTVYTIKHFGNLNAKERRRLYNIYGMTIVNWVETNPVVPLTVSTTIRMVDRLPEFIANAFPGYAESGLLPLILELGSPRNNSEE